MLEKYKDLNLNAKKYLESELNSICSDKDILKRCFKEMDILFDRGILFIIKGLYDYKKDNKGVTYFFEHGINNLMLLYELGLTNVNPVKYNLPYELYRSDKVNLAKVSTGIDSLIKYFNENENITIVKGMYRKSFVPELQKMHIDHYFFITKDGDVDINNLDYQEIGRNYITEETYEYLEVDDPDIEKKITDILKPKTFDDYVRVKCLANCSNAWTNNQDKLYKEGKIEIKNLISCKEDVYEYLLKHDIDKDEAIDIIWSISPLYKDKLAFENEYIDLLKEHKCSDTFISIITNIYYLAYKGENISKYLLEKEKNN